jgi:hypothetical protein
MTLAVPQHIKYRVDQRDGLRDRWSGRTIGQGRNLHHRLLRSRGGENSISNLITLSGSGTTGTHGQVHANPEIATRYGFIVPTGLNPERVPIRLADQYGRRAWHLLNWEGSTTLLSPGEALQTMRALGVWGPTETWL